MSRPSARLSASTDITKKGPSPHTVPREVSRRSFQFWNDKNDPKNFFSRVAFFCFELVRTGVNEFGLRLGAPEARLDFDKGEEA